MQSRVIGCWDDGQDGQMDGSVMDESRDRGWTGKLMDKYNTISIDWSISVSENNKGHNYLFIY